MKKSLRFLTKPGSFSTSKKISRLLASLYILGFAAITSHAQLNVTLQAQGPLCGGFSTGTISAFVGGGAGPFTYLWSNGATTNPIQNLPVGTYSVTVTSASGTTGTASTTITSPAPIQASIVVTNCAIPGTMTINVTGGVTPYMYMWSTGATTPTIAIPSPGQYCVTVMDNNNCGYATCTMTGPALSVDVTATPVICGNAVGGTVTATASGGTSPFSYQWSNGATSASISNLNPGIYTVTVTSSNGCTATGVGNVVLAAGNFSAALNATQPVCAGNPTGSITTTVTGGGLPLSFVWSSGQTTQNISNLGPGLYSVTVTDVFGCTTTKSAALSYQSSMSVVLNPVNPTCAGLSNGSIGALASNGATPYTYLWNTGATTQTINNVSTGTYQVTVTDNLGCTKTASTTLTSPPAFTVTVNTSNASNCGVADGTVNAVVGNGGTPPYTYVWNNGSTSFSQNGLPAGTYTVTVTTAQGCTASASGTIAEPQNLVVGLTGSSSVCGTDNDGFLTANTTFGTPPYFYTWSHGAGNMQTVTNLPPGTYTVTVTSSQGCTGSATKVINGIPAINLSSTIENVKCFGASTGKVTVTASGGAPPLSFLWSNGASTQSLNNVPAASYTLTVTDNAGCSKTLTVNVTQPLAPLNISFNTSGGSCGNTGFATVNPAGGTPPYLYSWNTGATSQTINNLQPGNYAVTVTDANNCSATSSTNIAAFPQMNLVVSATNTTCNGTSDGTATAAVTGGTSPFQYLWGSNQTTATISNLSPGPYQVTVTDVNGCTQSGSATVQLGTGLNVSINATTFICPDEFGTATANASGGVSPYTWLWSTTQTTQTITGLVPNTYSVTATDTQGCFGSASVTLQPGGGFSITPDIQHVSCFGSNNGSISLNVTGTTSPYTYLWNTGANTSFLQNLVAGTYSVTVTDNTQCSRVESLTVNQPLQLTIGMDVFNGNCNSPGAISALPAGGTPPYQYLWSTGATDQSIFNLLPGSYSVTVTDGNGCTATAASAITAISLPTCTVQINQTITSIGGNDGQVTANVSGGTAPFNFSWNIGQSTQTLSNLGEGFYSVTVSDANNCQTVCDVSLYNPAKVGDFVWLDVDEDGIQDPGEVGLNGVSVKISGTNIYGNSVSQTIQSGPNGMYMFLVQPGSYKLTFTQPAGYVHSPANQGNNDAIDSDVNVFSGMTPVFTLASGETNLTIDAGFYLAPPCDNITVPGTICCDQTLCGPGVDPAPITQVAPATGGTGNIQYLWMFSTVPGPFDPNGWTSIDTATGPNYDPGPLYETTYFIRCVRRENCIQFLESNIVTITVGNVAVAQISAQEGGCVNTPINFTSAANGPGATYAWNFGDGIPATANTQNVPGVVWTGFGLKTVTLSVTRNGCTSTDIHQIYITNLPSLCGNALIIDAEAIDRTSVAVHWYFEKSDTVQRTFKVEWAWENDNFQALQIGVDSAGVDDIMQYTATHGQAKRGRNFYRVTLEDNQGTTLVSNIAEVYVVGDLTLVHVYPNPFSDLLTVELIERFGDMPITLELSSVEGRILEIYKAPTEGLKMEIPTGDLASGMYFLLVKYDGKPQKIFKLVK